MCCNCPGRHNFGLLCLPCSLEFLLSNRASKLLQSDILSCLYQHNDSALLELVFALQVLATIRLEVFRTLLMQRISYFDVHTPSELTNLISVELDTIRTFIFNNCTRDRGPRAAMEALGSVIVLFVLSWRLAPACAAVIVVTAIAAAVYRRHTKEIEIRQSKALQRMSGIAFQSFDNIRTVRSFAGASTMGTWAHVGWFMAPTAAL